MTGETEKEVSGWTVDTLRTHLAALLAERDLRYTQILDEMDRRYQQRHEAMKAELAADRAANIAALTAAKEAVTKAETATEKRFEGVNEFRQSLADQTRLQVTADKFDAVTDGINARLRTVEQRVDKAGGEKTGVSAATAMMLGVAGLVLTLIAVAVAVIASQ